MKRFIAVVILVLLFTLPVRADEVYSEQYGLSGADELYDALPDKTQDFFRENGIDLGDENWVSSLSGENVFRHIFDFLSKGAAAPLKSGAAIISVILVTAAFLSFGDTRERFTPALLAATLGVAAVTAADIWSSVSAASGAIKGCSTFMLSFVPVFASLVALSGGAVTAASMSALLLGAAQAVSSICAFVILPLMGGYLAMSMASGVSPLINQSGLVNSVKKVTLWFMSLLTTVFLGILGIQTAVNSAADNLTLKTAKFILGSCVPVAGTALSESVSTVSASVSLLRSSVGIYGVVALAITVLPIVLELVLWRISLFVCSGVAELFELSKISGLIKAVDAMVSLLLGLTLLTAGMFIISLAVVIGAGKGL